MMFQQAKVCKLVSTEESHGLMCSSVGLGFVWKYRTGK